MNAERAGAAEVIIVEPDDPRPGSPGAPMELPAAWKLIDARRGRGSQCAAGVRASQGELVMILHDDTDLPQDAQAQIDAAFADPRVGMTCFRLRFDHGHWLLRFYSLCSRLESPLTTFGDQAMVLRRSVYQAVGGFPDWPLFEDVELARRVRRHSPVVKLPASVTTSAVRFTANGLLRQQLFNGLLLGRFLLGTSPEHLAAVYERQRGVPKLEQAA
ncbi:glycosyl transferase family 2 [Thiorhodococcus mannitoliphagus]|uniref:Glycosyl transferase family 2 n=1 Tax=Thiorhodococcus mannitoliphagus TaxID=329406 RepID=A0A6P1DM58_9GAMM|nr:glycosyl transferase family 2 [Thiorhodococcus mannitoliphagus]